MKIGYLRGDVWFLAAMLGNSHRQMKQQAAKHKLNKTKIPF